MGNLATHRRTKPTHATIAITPRHPTTNHVLHARRRNPTIQILPRLSRIEVKEVTGGGAGGVWGGRCGGVAWEVDEIDGRGDGV